MLQKNSVRHTAVPEENIIRDCQLHQFALIIPIVYQLRRFFPEEFPYIYVAMLAVIAFLFVFDFKVFKPDKKCMLAFVVIGALIAVKMFLL